MIKFLLSLSMILVLSGNSWAAILVLNSNGTYTTKTTLAEAAIALDAVAKTVVITSPQVVTTAIAWPADRELRFEKGGYVTFTGAGALTGLKKAKPEDFGGAPDGVTESSVAIQKAINAALKVEIGPGVWRCDNPVSPRTHSIIDLQGELKRITAYSASTRPVLIINNIQLATVTGGGRITSQNASPDGVLLIGPEDPTVAANQTINIEWNTLEKLSITGAGTSAGNIGVKMQTVAGWGGANVCYQNWMQHLEIHSVAEAIYLGSQVNANIIKSIHGWNIGAITLHLAGTDGDDGVHGAGTYPYSSITDNVVSDIFTSNSYTLTHSVKAESASYNTFANIHGEPGSGRLFAFDANSESNVLQGVENHPQPGTDAGTRNSIRTNIIDRSVNANFAAYLSATAADVTGDGTPYLIPFDTEVFDKTGDYNPAGTFVAPVTGKYRFSGNVYLTGLGANHKTVVIALSTTSKSWTVYTEVIASQDKTIHSINFSTLADLAATEGAWVVVTVTGSTKTVDVYGGASPLTHFSGELLP